MSTLQKKPWPLTLFCLLLSSGTLATVQPPNPNAEAETLISKMKDAVAQMRSYSVIHHQQERFGNKMGPKMKMKVKYSDGKLYVRMLEGPKKDAEILFLPGENNGKVRAHPGSFPDLTLSLDPHGSRMMKDQHHPVEHLSFQHIVSSLIESAQKCRGFPGAGATFINPTPSPLMLELKAPWKEIAETVLKDEDIWSFSKRVKADPSLIVHNNSLDGLDDVSEGMSLKVPLCYATRTLLSIHPTTYLPEHLETYDSQGQLYESYRWENLDTTTPLTKNDFDPDNKEYHF